MYGMKHNNYIHKADLRLISIREILQKERTNENSGAIKQASNISEECKKIYTANTVSNEVTSLCCKEV